MVHIITSRNAHLYEQELESCYRLRHQVFVEERGWNAIRRPDGREIDQFDTPSATHLAVIRDGKLAAYSRILPTTEPHLLSDVYPWLVATGDIPRGPHIWEWTRLCVAPEFRWGNSLSDAGWEAILGIVEYSLANGIFLLTGEGHPIWITRFLELGFQVDPLGLPHHMDGEDVIAMLFKISWSTLTRIRELRGTRASVLEDRSGFIEAPAAEERTHHVFN
ncbi:MAG TPA: acyl-homoserine-lactone synthase [Kaistiaceae bacterium]|nr:acyl-homoserine-lactone synthase [Kaistiaceae bacterium]